MHDARCTCWPLLLIMLWLIILGGPWGCGAAAPISRLELQPHTYSVSHPQFLRVMGSLFGSEFTHHNSINTLVDAQQIVPAMLMAIDSAQHTITFETYVYWDGEIAAQFAQALAARARAGVRVHVIVDAVGSDRMDAEHVRLMENAGVQLVRYNPPEKILLLFTVPEVLNRTHRKLLIVDGTVAFIGGIGIADVWLGNDDKQPWRETHYRVIGPVVAQLQAAFMDNWIEHQREVLDGEHYFPSLAPAGNHLAQVMRSSPEHGSASMEVMYILAINAAAESIHIGNPYFVPNDLMIQALTAAAERGVKIQIVVPGPHNDQQIVRSASRARWQQLLDAGVELYEFQPSMLHYKIMVVDGLWSSVGSANLDPRSLRFNDEANLNVYDRQFAQQQIEIIQRDIAQSDRITRIEHERRSIVDRMSEFFASWLAPQL